MVDADTWAALLAPNPLAQPSSTATATASVTSGTFPVPQTSPATPSKSEAGGSSQFSEQLRSQDQSQQSTEPTAASRTYVPVNYQRAAPAPPSAPEVSHGCPILHGSAFLYAQKYPILTGFMIRPIKLFSESQGAPILPGDHPNHF